MSASPASSPSTPQVAPPPALRPLERTPLHTLANPDVAIGIEQDTGWIRSLRFKERDVDLFRQVRQNQPGWIGGLRVFDEREQRWFSDLEHESTLSAMARRGDTVAFSKRFAGAAFRLDVVLRLEADALHWEVRAEKLDPAAADRSLRVYFFLPLIAGWDVWAPAHDAEFTFDGMTSFEYA